MWEHKKGEGIWAEYVNSDTGESSVKEYSPKELKTFCAQNEHNYQPISPTSRHVICTRCGLGAYYILGLQTLVDGRIVNRVPAEHVDNTKSPNPVS